jgi:hypothetical protein
MMLYEMSEGRGLERWLASDFSRRLTLRPLADLAAHQILEIHRRRPLLTTDEPKTSRSKS